MKLCRFQTAQKDIRIGMMVGDTSIMDLTDAGVTSLTPLFEGVDLAERVKTISQGRLGRWLVSDVTILPPVDQQEIWAAGVTYLRSKTARMEESEFSASAYDKVYDAPRPELFFKCLPQKAVGTNTSVGIRRDAKWNVPEPELGLVINSRGKIVGYTICNDMSSRDIEGENLLYLAQAKVYHRSCALGPYVRIGASEEEARQWTIRLTIRRFREPVFTAEVSVDQIKRKFDDLVQYLFRSQFFPHGAILSTGTGIVPEDSFTLQPDDEVEIDISGIGKLVNTVEVV